MREVMSLNNLLARAGGDEDGFPALWNDGTLLMRYFIKWSACACYYVFSISAFDEILLNLLNAGRCRSV